MKFATSAIVKVCGLFRSAGQDNHRILSQIVRIYIRILGGANVVVLQLRVGVADHLYRLTGTAARRSALPRERFSPLARNRHDSGFQPCPVLSKSGR
jgi:hypothetical protein